MPPGKFDLTGAPGTLWGREPVAILVTCHSVLVAAGAFGFELTSTQLGGVILALNAVLGLLTRASVVSPDTNGL